MPATCNVCNKTVDGKTILYFNIEYCSKCYNDIVLYYDVECKQ